MGASPPATSDSDSESEDEEEAARRKELASCVMTGEMVLCQAKTAPKQRKNPDARATDHDEAESAPPQPARRNQHL